MKPAKLVKTSDQNRDALQRQGGQPRNLPALSPSLSTGASKSPRSLFSPVHDNSQMSYHFGSSLSTGETKLDTTALRPKLNGQISPTVGLSRSPSPEFYLESLTQVPQQARLQHVLNELESR